MYAIFKKPKTMEKVIINKCFNNLMIKTKL